MYIYYDPGLNHPQVAHLSSFPSRPYQTMSFSWAECQACPPRAVPAYFYGVPVSVVYGFWGGGIICLVESGDESEFDLFGVSWDFSAGFCPEKLDSDWSRCPRFGPCEMGVEDPLRDSTR